MALAPSPRQPYPDVGTLYRYPSAAGSGRLFVVDQGAVEESFGGLEDALRFAQACHPGPYEAGTVCLPGQEAPSFFLKGHPYESLVTLARLEQAMPKARHYRLMPLRKLFGTEDVIVTEYVHAMTAWDVFLHAVIGDEARLARERLERSIARLEKTLKRAPSGRDRRALDLRRAQLGEIWESVYAGFRDVVYGRNFESYVFFVESRFEEAIEECERDLKRTAARIGLGAHADSDYRNVMFRGVRRGRILFSLIDQYCCGCEEVEHGLRKGAIPMELSHSTVLRDLGQARGPRTGGTAK